MARPTKKGIDYFSVDTKFDDEITLIMAKFGAEGLGILVTLWQIIYNNGFYIQWTEKELLVYNNRFYVDSNRVQEVIDECLKWKIFNNKLYEKYQILTSSGIQKRYLSATERRSKFDVELEFWLLEKVNANINLINVYNNSKKEDKSTQSKVKESKVKESNIYSSDFEILWDIYPRKKEKAKALKAYNARINERVKLEQLLLATKNYKEECKKNKIQEKYIKHPATFWGPNRPYEDYLRIGTGVREENANNEKDSSNYYGLGIEL